jgi:DNA-binding NarL/FixJ family response regulator
VLDARSKSVVVREPVRARRPGGKPVRAGRSSSEAVHPDPSWADPLCPGGTAVSSARSTSRAPRAGRRGSPFVAPAVGRVQLAIQAIDPLSQAGLAQHVARRPDIELLPPSRLAEADIVAVAAPMMTARVMEQMRRSAEIADPKFVLVLERLGDIDLLSAIEIGTVSVLWRSEATAERFTQVVVSAGRGGTEMPPEVQARLVADIAALQRDLLTPLGLTAGGLDDREVDVLRYIADGLDTSEIAQKMLYSERTVKGILYGLMSRLHLRNRSHAVAYAMRAGIL